MRSLLGLLALATLSLPLAAQEAEPFSRTGDLYVIDNPVGFSSVYRLIDANLDGDYLDPGERIDFFDEALAGFLVGVLTGLSVGPDGTVYLTEGAPGRVFSLRDGNQDGDANDPGELVLYFDGTGFPPNNGSGIGASSLSRLCVDANGIVWFANNNTNFSSTRGIIRLQDLNGDGDANDAGEAQQYADFQPQQNPGGWSTVDLFLGPGGDIYYVRFSYNPAAISGVYRLHDDVIPDGQIQVASEASPFFIPANQPAPPVITSACIDQQGVFWCADVANNTVWRMEDLNGDFTITESTGEAAIVWSGPSTGPNTNLFNKLMAASDGTLMATDISGPQQVWRFREGPMPDGDFLDPGELAAITGPDFASAGDLAFARAPTLGLPTPVSLSSAFNLTLDSQRDRPFFLWASDAPASVPAPPFGVLGLDLVPPAVAQPVLQGLIPPSGRFTLPVPPLASIVAPGTVLYLQALAGPQVRFQLSNAVTLTFVP